jgi:DNA-binding beta-propeller fold protein YncE
MKTKNMPRKFVLFFIIPFLFFSCIKTEQEYYLNKNGTGKVNVRATMPLDMKMSFQTNKSNGKQDSDYHDSIKMINKVKEIIQNTKGVDAINDLDYKLKENQLNVSFTAYFSDIEEVDLDDIPLIPVTKFSKEGIFWAGNPQLSDKLDEGKDFSGTEIQGNNPSETVEEIQQQFQKSKMMMGMILSGFSIESTYHLPYAVKNPQNLDQTGKYTLKLVMSGDDILNKYESFIEDDKKLKNLVQRENIQHFSLKDTTLFRAIFPKGYIYGSGFKTGWFSPKTKSYLDYNKELQQISPKFPDLKEPKRTGSEGAEVYNIPPSQYQPAGSIETDDFTHNLYRNQLAVYKKSMNKSEIEIIDTRKNTTWVTFPVNIGENIGANLDRSPNGRRLAFSISSLYPEKHGLIIIYDVHKKTLVQKLPTSSGVYDFQWLSENTFAFTQKNNKVYRASLNGKNVSIEDSVMLSVKKGVNSFNPGILGVMKDDEDLLLLVYDYYLNQIVVREANSFKVIRKLPVKRQSTPRQILASPNPRYISLLFEDHIEVFVNGKPYKMITDIKQPLRKVSWNPAGNYLIYINGDQDLVYHGMGADAQKIIVNGKDNYQSEGFITVGPFGKMGITKNKNTEGKIDVIKMNFD